MKKLKNITLCLSLGALTTTLPYIPTQALPIDDLNEKQVISPSDIFKIEDKNIKRNLKEEMAEVLVKLYNSYNTIFKKGLEKNDVSNSDLYFNITKQKSQIKELINDIIEYPYSIVNSEIEQKFLKSNILFCYLSNEYLSEDNLNVIFNNKDENSLIEDLNTISDIVDFSTLCLKNIEGVPNLDLEEDVKELHSIIKNIYDVDSFKLNQSKIEDIINNVYYEIKLSLDKHIHK